MKIILKINLSHINYNINKNINYYLNYHIIHISEILKSHF